MITIIIGVLSSAMAELVTAINKKLQGTVLKGDGAFLLALVMALVGAVVKEVITPGFVWSDLTNITALSTTFGEIFSVSQIYFYYLVQKFNLDVSATPTSTGTV